jgi:hypothetical protein
MTKNKEKDIQEATQDTVKEAIESGDQRSTRDVRVRFDDANMSSNYANVANVGMSKDEVTLLFGTNKTWGAVKDEVVIDLSSRVILTPSVAKSFAETLQRVLNEYEKQVGKII